MDTKRQKIQVLNGIAQLLLMQFFPTVLHSGRHLQ